MQFCAGANVGICELPCTIRVLRHRRGATTAPLEPHEVSGGVLWANLHLLFWLSLTPFVSAWIGEHHFQTAPIAAYGFAGIGLSLLQPWLGFALCIVVAIIWLIPDRRIEDRVRH